MAERVRTRKFQAQTQKLLDLMIHSVYAQRDVFLREIISNASDAIDKVRFQALTDRSLTVTDSDFRIKLVPDAESGTLTVVDNGIGMTDDEVVTNLGTIARSGSEAFLAEMAREKPDQAAADLIGQFGVGFYSAFMVADAVTVITQKHGADHAVRWHATGGERYEIQKLPPRERGTSVTLHFKAADAEDGDDDTHERPPAEAYTDPGTLRRIVKQYSDFIAFPIVMDEDGEEETLNSMKPLWTRSRDEIERHEYDEFYRHITHDWNDPYDVIHVHAEGTHEYTALLYLPSQAPLDLYTREHRRGLQLYAKRVFIMEECRELMPEHLRFVRGLVDSPEISLNISRETVQQDRLIAAMRRHLTRRTLDVLATRLEEDREGYEAFWGHFGPVLKEGFHYEPTARERLEKLLLFRTAHDDGWTTLPEYVSRMADGMEAIYTLSGEDLDLLRHAPQLEALGRRGIEVLLLTDPVDDLVVSVLSTHDDKPFRSAAAGEIDPDGIGAAAPAAADGDDDADADGATDEALAPLLARLGELLAEDVETVRVSKRLTDSAVCLVRPEGGLSPGLERMMAAVGQELPTRKRVLEINAKHPLTARLAAMLEADRTDPQLGEFAALLLDQALLAEGEPVKNPARFAQRVAAIMARAE